MTRPAPWVASLALAAGCVLVDDRELAIDPPGVLFAGVGGPVDAAGRPVFELEVRSAGREVDLEIDGRPLGPPFPAGKRLRVDASLLSPGPHRLTVRERDVTPAGTAERTLAFYPVLPEVAGMEPPPTAGALGTPFTARLLFTQKVVPELVPGNAWLEAGGARLPGRARVSPGGRAVEIDLPAAVPSYGAVSLRVRAAAFALPGDAVYEATWSAALLRARIVVPSGRLRGVVPVRVETVAGSTIPPLTELLVDGQVVASFDVPPPDGTWRADWDSSTVADGMHRMALRVSPGSHFAYEAPPPEVFTDNVGPVVTGCARNEVRPRGCWSFTLDSTGSVEAATLRVGNGAWALGASSTGTWCPPGGVAMPEFDVTTMDGSATLEVLARDPSGLAATSTCRAPFPAWEARWGDPLPGIEAEGPVSFGDSSVCAYVMVDGFPRSLCPGGENNAIATVGRTGSERGKVLVRNRGMDGSWTVSAPLNSGATSVAHGLSSGYWIERTGSGPGQVILANGSSQNLDPARDAGGVVAMTHLGGSNWRDSAIAWTEDVLPAGRIAVVGYRPLDLRLDPAARVEEIAVLKPTWDPFEPGPMPFIPTYLAWTEVPPGGVARLRGAVLHNWEPAWILDGVSNADPATPAYEPSIHVRSGLVSVAWREGGAAIVRTLTAEGPSEPVILNVGPARPARLVRFDVGTSNPTVYWVEREGEVDLVFARFWDGERWRLFPGPLNSPVPGRVEALTVLGSRVAWVDDAGGVHVRFLNAPP